tara:strand:- start:1075 stop:1446 length:372 start_codon:yes stop_codon:yes gene_type:complete
VINPEEERFFASESLQGVLTPEMLVDKTKKKNNFCFLIGEESYEIESYSETPRSIVVVLLCEADSIGPILSIDQKEIKIKSGKSIIARDVARYDLSWEIVRSVDSNCKAILNFTQNHVGVING